MAVVVFMMIGVVFVIRFLVFVMIVVVYVIIVVVYVTMVIVSMMMVEVCDYGNICVNDFSIRVDCHSISDDETQMSIVHFCNN